jgi:hypothetical protein
MIYRAHLHNATRGKKLVVGMDWVKLGWTVKNKTGRGKNNPHTRHVHVKIQRTHLQKDASGQKETDAAKIIPAHVTSA